MRKFHYVLILWVLLGVVLATIFTFKSQLATFFTNKPTANPNQKLTLVHPSATHVTTSNWAMGQYVTYEMTGVNVFEYYENLLKEESWQKTIELESKSEDCGEDWGGTYEKENKKFIIHICGLNNEQGNIKSITYYFYGATKPSDILGK